MENEENVLPKGINDELIIISRKTGKTEAEIKELFNLFLHSEGMELVEHHEACELALEQVKKSIFSTKFITGSPEYILMEFQVLHITINSPSHNRYDYREQKLKQVNDTERIGYVSGVFHTAPDAQAGSPVLKPCFGILTLWKDAIEIIKELEEGQVYRLDLAVKVRDSILELSLSKYQQPTRVFTELPKPKDVITQAIKPIQPNEVELHVGNNRLVHGIIVSGKTWNAKKTGKLTGKLALIPAKCASLTDRSFTVMWFSNPELATRYKPCTECYVLVHIESSVENGIVGQGRAIIPINPIEEDEPDIFSDGDWI